MLIFAQKLALYKTRTFTVDQPLISLAQFEHLIADIEIH